LATVSYDLPLSPLMLEAVVGDDAIVYNASDVRLMLGAMYPRPGRIGLGDALWLYPRAAGANWSVDVQAGQAVIQGNASSYTPERYLVTLAERTNLSLAAFNTAPTVTRTHAVYVAVDNKETSGTTYGARLVVTEDTGAGAPVPTASWARQLGTVTIAPAQSNIADTHLSTFMLRASTGTFAFNVELPNVGIYAGFTGGSPYGSPDPRFSLTGNTVRMSGAVRRTSGNFAVGTTYTIGRMPVGYRPRHYRLGLATASGPNIARVTIGTDGDIAITPYGANLSGMEYVQFDSIAYEID